MDLIIKSLKSGKKVGFAPMTTEIESMAAKQAGDATKLSGQLKFLNECIKMTLREVDGVSFNYEKLGNLDATFSMKEVRELRDAFNQINFDEDDSPLV